MPIDWRITSPDKSLVEIIFQIMERFLRSFLHASGVYLASVGQPLLSELAKEDLLRHHAAHQILLANDSHFRCHKMICKNPFKKLSAIHNSREKGAAKIIDDRIKFKERFIYPLN
jgi:hypothetical protein